MVVIKNRIYLEARFLDANYEQHIIDNIRKKYEMTCTKEYGYIISVDKINSIENSTISSVTSAASFNVEFVATALKPEIDLLLAGSVCVVFSPGIFVQVQDRLKILIPSSKLSDMEYCELKIRL